MASTYQVELDDTSPIISYAPSGDPLATNADLRKGWSPAFSNISLIALGQQGSGSTSHVTSCDGAIMTIRWIGTSIQLFGSVSSADYTILLDGSLQLGFTSSRDTNMLASINKLSNANHTISLVAHVNSTGGLVAFDKAILTVSAEVAK
ncbi:hypothetical protein JAAARDRAFT_133366 [Jaapia argillacea MUCL 33604]|uniref:Uncharacterized protein n=1 Tax=Jaapia argillacea MUCL 33604 TaxID=933084 RepID=A0A067PLN7_9AGAM|nr:hypothetical protein JAAARDRAFT_133366 [Jaapia argillacea MUCL 33604]